MTARRRNLRITAALVVVMAALVIWFGRGGGKMEVKLVFVGYTNRTIIYTNLYGDSRDVSIDEVCASVLATNSGQMPVWLSAAWRRHTLPMNFRGTPLIGGVMGLDVTNLPKNLQPGEKTLLEFTFNQPSAPWAIELSTTRRGFRDRMHGRVAGTSLPPLRRFLVTVFPPPPEVVVKLGPITNLPPDAALEPPPRVARP